MNTLTITPSLGTITISAIGTAIEQRNRLLKDAAEVQEITDRLDADSAVITLKEIRSFMKEVETARKEAKAPVDALAAKIQETSREVIGDLAAEESRLERLCGAYEAEQRRKAEEARRKAEEEARRIREKADADARAAARAAETQEEASRKAEEIVSSGEDKVAEIKQELAKAAPAAKRPGMTLRTTVEFEVTDIGALYADNPALVKLEANTAAIKAIIKANPNIKLNGLRHWTVEKL
jgi:hypothetical protein